MNVSWPLCISQMPILEHAIRKLIYSLSIYKAAKRCYVFWKLERDGKYQILVKSSGNVVNLLLQPLMKRNESRFYYSTQKLLSEFLETICRNFGDSRPSRYMSQARFKQAARKLMCGYIGNRWLAVTSCRFISWTTSLFFHPWSIPVICSLSLESALASTINDWGFMGWDLLWRGVTWNLPG